MEWFGWWWAATMEAAKPVLIGIKAAETLYLLSIELSSMIKDLNK